MAREAHAANMGGAIAGPIDWIEGWNERFVFLGWDCHVYVPHPSGTKVQIGNLKIHTDSK